MDVITQILSHIHLDNLLHYLSIILFVIGSFFMLTSAFGMLRMPGFFLKLHAMSIGDALASPLIMIAIAINSQTIFSSIKIIILLILFIIINPVISYCLSQAALYNGINPIEKIKNE